MKNYTYFIVLWVVNAILLYLATLIFPENFVLGNFRWNSAYLAAAVAGLIWAILVWGARFIASSISIKKDAGLVTITFYWFANFIALWLAARLANISGFGVSRFTWAAVLALVAYFVQMGVWNAIED